MPIYAYACSACGHRQDILQKLSDSPLSECPNCHEASFSKQLTAPGFVLKGSGWYVTDFRDNGSKKTSGETPAKAPEPSATQPTASNDSSAGAGGSEATTAAASASPADSGPSSASSNKAQTATAGSAAS